MIQLNPNRKIENVNPDASEKTATNSFTTLDGGLVSALNVAFTPIQDLHGQSKPWAGGAGKNQMPLDLATIKTLNTDGTWSGNVYSWRGIDYTVEVDSDNNVIGISASGTATQRGWIYLCRYNFGNESIYFNNVTSGGYTYTSGNNHDNTSTQFIYYNSASPYNTYLRIDTDVTLTDEKWYPMIRLSSIADPTFEPYSNICPISGHTEAKSYLVGKNQFDINSMVLMNKYFTVNGAITSYTNTRTIYAPCQPNTPYTLSKMAGGRFRVGTTRTLPAEGVSVYQGVQNDTASSITITTDADAQYIVAFVWFLDSDTEPALTILESCQIEKGSTPTAYEPYVGQTYTTSLGGTYYGGDVEQVSGEGKQIYDIVDLGDLNWSYEASWGAGADFYTSGLVSLAKLPLTDDDKGNILCTQYENKSRNSFYNSAESAVTLLKGGVLKVRDSRYSDTATFKTAMAGVKLVYDLATPTALTLTGQNITAEVGENNVSAPLENQEIVEDGVTYKEMFSWADVVAYVQSQVNP